MKSTPAYNQKSSSNGVSKHPGSGATAACRHALDMGPASVDRLSQLTGLHARIVRSAIGQLVSMGGAVRFERGTKTLYALYRDAPKPKEPRASGEYAIARPISVGRGLRWFL